MKVIRKTQGGILGTLKDDLVWMELKGRVLEDALSINQMELSVEHLAVGGPILRIVSSIS